MHDMFIWMYNTFFEPELRLLNKHDILLDVNVLLLRVKICILHYEKLRSYLENSFAFVHVTLII